MDDALARVRAEAVGQELDEELVARFPLKETYDIFVDNGDGETVAHVYEPLDRNEVTPLIVNMHGGGFVKKYRGQDIIFARNLAYNSGCLVVDVDYKTAPEKMYPYALMEGYATVKYMYENHEKYRIDPNRIILSGQSAGANLITGIAFLAKERKEFEIAQLILAYPPLDLVTDPVSKPLVDTPEERKRAETGRLYNDWYVAPERRREICVSPVFAERKELEGLPPFVILSAGLDSLGEEAERFALQLIQAGVKVTAKRFLTAKHGFLVRRSGEFAEAEEMIFETIDRIKRKEDPVKH